MLVFEFMAKGKVSGALSGRVTINSRLGESSLGLYGLPWILEHHLWKEAAASTYLENRRYI
jgi:hypothetical protein